MTPITTLEERQAKAKVKALSEGVRVALVESTDTIARYVAMSHTHPGIAYQVTLHIAEGSDECNCPAGAHGTPCKHLAASEMMFAAQLKSGSGASFEPCAITGLPLLPGEPKTRCKGCQRPASVESWNKFVASSKTCPWCRTNASVVLK